MHQSQNFEDALKEIFPCREQRRRAREKALERAHDIRKFEIGLYWKRTTYFWTLLAAVFAGFFLIQTSEDLNSDNKQQDFSVLLAHLGFTLSFGWWRVNKGSKFWQESWESIVDQIEDKVTGPLYKFEVAKQDATGSIRRLLVGPSPISVSKINLLASFYVTVVWLGLILYSLQPMKPSLPIHEWYVALTGLTLFACILFVAWGKTGLRGYLYSTSTRIVGRTRMSESCVIGPRLQTERLSDGRRELSRSLRIKVHGYDEIEIPQGFDTDYSSIPTCLHWIVRWSKVDVAGVVHDWLYRKGNLSRSEADKVWRLVALSGEHSANRLQAWTCLLGLWLFGGCAWSDHFVERSQATKDDSQEEQES